MCDEVPEKRLVPKAKATDAGKIVAINEAGKPALIEPPAGGGATEATRASVEDPNTNIGNTYVSPRRGWVMWEKIKTLASTFTQKITFSQPPNFAALAANKYLKLDANKDLETVATIPASNIEQDETSRFVTDAEKAGWNDKQAPLGFVPEDTSKKGVANGYQGLNANAKTPAIAIEQDPNNRFVSDAEKATYAGKQDALGASATATQISTPKRVRVGNVTATNNMFDLTSDGAGDIMNLRRSDGSSAVQLVSNGNGWNATSTSASWGAEINASTTIGIRGKSYMYSVSDGNIQFMNNAGNGFTSMNLGPRTVAFPMFKVNGPIVQARLGDDSGYTQIDVAGLRINGNACPSGSFTDPTGKVITVVNGAITSIAG